MLGLSHLVVCDAGPAFQRLSQLLPMFKSLETLCLYNCSMPDSSKHKEVPFPALHMNVLPKLRNVELDMVLPCSIQLCEACELHSIITGRLTT
jgi:hypothetical protein